MKTNPDGSMNHDKEFGARLLLKKDLYLKTNIKTNPDAAIGYSRGFGARRAPTPGHGGGPHPPFLALNAGLASPKAVIAHHGQ